MKNPVSFNKSMYIKMSIYKVRGTIQASHMAISHYNYCFLFVCFFACACVHFLFAVWSDLKRSVLTWRYNLHRTEIYLCLLFMLWLLFVCIEMHLLAALDNLICLLWLIGLQARHPCLCPCSPTDLHTQCTCTDLQILDT